MNTSRALPVLPPTGDVVRVGRVRGPVWCAKPWLRDGQIHAEPGIGPDRARTAARRLLHEALGGGVVETVHSARHAELTIQNETDVSFVAVTSAGRFRGDNPRVPLLVDPVVPAGAMSQIRQPVLSGPTVALRPFEQTDAPMLVVAYADPDIQRWHVHSVTTDEAGAWVERTTRCWAQESAAEWAVTTPEAQFVGRMGMRLVDLEEGIAEVAYWMLPQHRGHGYATAALTVLSDWALGTLGLGRIELNHSVHNLGSCRVAERGGYQFEGIKRHAGLHADGWHDLHLHARVPGS